MASKLIVAAFPTAAIKVCIQSEDGAITYQQLCWMPEFEKVLKNALTRNERINEIYVLGPDNYISRFIDTIHKLTDLPVIEERM